MRKSATRTPHEPRAAGRPRLALAAITLAALTAGLTGCGSDEGSSDEATTTTEVEAECRTVEGAAAETTAPDPTVPEDAVTGIEKVDDLVGCGDEVEATSTVTVHYVLKSQSSGAVVDSSWDRGTPFDVTLGQQQVISGWEEGIPGMRAGGRRTLVLGPDYGYGVAGSPPDIAPNDTLVFVVDVLSVS
jgi:peptidylprolyl isomerase